MAEMRRFHYSVQSFRALFLKIGRETLDAIKELKVSYSIAVGHVWTISWGISHVITCNFCVQNWEK